MHTQASDFVSLSVFAVCRRLGSVLLFDLRPVNRTFNSFNNTIEFCLGTKKRNEIDSVVWITDVWASHPAAGNLVHHYDKAPVSEENRLKYFNRRMLCGCLRDPDTVRLHSRSNLTLRLLFSILG